MSRDSVNESAMENQVQASAERKRKRKDQETEEELEIDVNLPEPPSKKAKRKEKKAEKQKTKKPSEAPTIKDGGVPVENSTSDQKGNNVESSAKQRSDYGIWIGNLNFATTKDDLRKFLLEEGSIADSDVTRIHLPPPKDGGAKKLEKNRGFAYIDFATQESLEKALLLTEKFLFGRNVLIKNAKSFEGRPSKPAEGQTGAAKTIGTKEPTKRIFVGNLGFDVTREEIAEHFGQAGEVADVFLATFEDSGKCKGFGWVRFAEIDAAEAAVRGFIFKDPENKVEDEDDSKYVDGDTEKALTDAKKAKQRKWFINRLQGRELRCEFAEDANTRYKKRFGKEGRASKFNNSDSAVTQEPHPAVQNGGRAKQDHRSSAATSKPYQKGSANADERREQRRKRHEKMDARNIAPGQAHAGAPRASAAIVAGVGKKTSFD